MDLRMINKGNFPAGNTAGKFVFVPMFCVPIGFFFYFKVRKDKRSRNEEQRTGKQCSLLPSILGVKHATAYEIHHSGEDGAFGEVSKHCSQCR